MNLHRMWVNQPSTAQPDHDLHGQNVLMDEEEREDGKVMIYLVFHDVQFQLVFSRLIDKRALSTGWR